jgi:hypothetical protein
VRAKVVVVGGGGYAKVEHGGWVVRGQEEGKLVEDRGCRRGRGDEIRRRGWRSRVVEGHEGREEEWRSYVEVEEWHVRRWGRSCEVEDVRERVVRGGVGWRRLSW